VPPVSSAQDIVCEAMRQSPVSSSAKESFYCLMIVLCARCSLLFTDRPVPETQNWRMPVKNTVAPGRAVARMTTLTITVPSDLAEAVEVAAALNDESSARYLRDAVDDVLYRWLVRLSPEEFDSVVAEALKAPSSETDLGTATVRVGVRIPASDKERLEFLAQALRRSAASLLREGLQRVLDKGLNGRSVEEARIELVARYSRRAAYFRHVSEPTTGATDALESLNVGSTTSTADDR
jgi:predicted transcriptional regulator